MTSKSPLRSVSWKSFDDEITIPARVPTRARAIRSGGTTADSRTPPPRLLRPPSTINHLQVLRLLLSSSDGAYFTGETVSGFVILELSQPADIAEVKIELSGEVHVHRGDTSSGDMGRCAVMPCLNQTLVLSNEEDMEEQMLEAGKHVYDFEFSLPTDLPSSVEQENGGWVRYLLRTVISDPSGHVRHCLRALTVSRLVDIATVKDAKESQSRTKELTYGSLCCCQRTSNLRLTVDKTAYTVGDKMTVTCQLTPARLQDVIFCRFNLISNVDFNVPTKGGIKQETYVSSIVSETTGTPVVNEGGVCFTQQLVVPPLPPTDTRTNQLIQQHYAVAVLLKFVGQRKAERHVVKVIICSGTSPSVDSASTIDLLNSLNSVALHTADTDTNNNNGKALFYVNSTMDNDEIIESVYL